MGFDDRTIMSACFPLQLCLYYLVFPSESAPFFVAIRITSDVGIPAFASNSSS